MPALASTIAGTVKEHQIKGPTGALASRLAGQQLLYMKTANGFSDEEHVYLCSDGSAAISSTNSAFLATGSSAFFSSRR